MVNGMQSLVACACFGSECSDTINGNGLVHGAVNNSCRVLSVDEKRAHRNIFVKKIIVITAKTS